jgi:hypothetical protein
MLYPSDVNKRTSQWRKPAFNVACLSGNSKRGSYGIAALDLLTSEEK